MTVLVSGSLIPSSGVCKALCPGLGFALRILFLPWQTVTPWAKTPAPRGPFAEPLHPLERTLAQCWPRGALSSLGVTLPGLTSQPPCSAPCGAEDQSFSILWIPTHHSPWLGPPTSLGSLHSMYKGFIKMAFQGVPWWSSIKTPCFYFQGPRFDPWSGN